VQRNLSFFYDFSKIYQIIFVNKLINEKDMQAAIERMESVDIEAIFNPQTIKLELTDESDEAKLLGIDVHLNFES